MNYKILKLSRFLIRYYVCTIKYYCANALMHTLILRYFRGDARNMHNSSVGQQHVNVSQND